MEILQKNKRQGRFQPCLHIWRSIRDLNSGGAVNALSHFESCKVLADRCRRWSKPAGSSSLFRDGWSHFAKSAKTSSMAQIFLKHPFCSDFTRFWGKMQDKVQDKREPISPHGNRAGVGPPTDRTRKMRDLNPISRTNSQKYSTLYNLQPFSGVGRFTHPSIIRRTQSW